MERVENLCCSWMWLRKRKHISLLRKIEVRAKIERFLKNLSPFDQFHVPTSKQLQGRLPLDNPVLLNAVEAAFTILEGLPNWFCM